MRRALFAVMVGVGLAAMASGCVGERGRSATGGATSTTSSASAQALVALPSASAAPEEGVDASAEDAASPRKRVEKLSRPAIEVREENGNLYVADAEGNEAELLRSGRDVFPALSLDGTLVIFLRRVPDPNDEYRRDLYLARLDGSAPELLLRDDSKRLIGGPESPRLTHMYNPQIFPDNKRATISVESGRGEAIVSVDFQTKKIAWLTSGAGYEHVLVPRGPHAGDLVVVKHRYSKDPAGGSYDECVLVDGKTGKEKQTLEGDTLDCADSPSLRQLLQY